MNREELGPLYVVMRRETPPTAGMCHAAVLDATQHMGYSDVHWTVLFRGTDAAAFAAACHAAGIEVPSSTP